MIMIIYFCKFLELNVPTQKTEETAGVLPKTAIYLQKFFLPFLTKLDISASWTTYCFSKKNPLVFALSLLADLDIPESFKTNFFF